MNEGPFRLYPYEQHWWSFSDYASVLRVMCELKPKRVLEFGPGSSTLALLEGGAEWVDTCEDDLGWFATYVERLEDRFPDRVCVRSYNYRVPLFVPTVESECYDLALIDGPKEKQKRPAVIEYALARCAAVLVPLEEGEAGEPCLRRYIRHMVGVTVEWMEDTGPLAGAFALVRRA